MTRELASVKIGLVLGMAMLISNLFFGVFRDS